MIKTNDSLNTSKQEKPQPPKITLNKPLYETFSRNHFRHPKHSKKINKYKLFSILIIIIQLILNIILVQALLHKPKEIIKEVYIEIPTEISEPLSEEIVEPTNKTTIAEETTSRSISAQREDTAKFKVTAYCACSKCCGKSDGITASGKKATANHTIAADTSVIPMGTEVYIEGYGTYVVEDTGGVIKGNKIDMYFDSHQDALDFGVKYLNVNY